jgi:hypothetical protein
MDGQTRRALIEKYSESGRYSVERWLEIYAHHAHNHADQIRRARAAARSPQR